MSNASKKLITLALVGAGTFAAWKLGGALLSDASGTEHAVNQLWIDHIPRDERDMITHFIVLDHPQGKFGTLGRSSQWRHLIDVFRWQLHGGELSVYFPQERARAKLQIETWECAGEAPDPFELCMRVTTPQGRSWMFYSREEWEINPRGAAGSLAGIVESEPRLGAVLGSVSEDQAALTSTLDLEQAEHWAERDLGLGLR
jgi:hypothetical protein